MDSEEGTQQPHLVLAHKLFLLRHPDVQDIEKVRLKDEVIAAIKSDGNSPSPPIPQRFSPSHSSDSNSHFIFLFLFLCRYGSVVQNPSRCRRFGIGERKRAEEIENMRERERQINNSSLSQWRRWGPFRFASVLCLWVYYVVVAQIGGGVVKPR